MAKTQFVETRVQVGISYDHVISYDQEKKLLDHVPNVGDFIADENYYQGHGCQKEGFVIFKGTHEPTRSEINDLRSAVRKGVKAVKQIIRY